MTNVIKLPEREKLTVGSQHLSLFEEVKHKAKNIGYLERNSQLSQKKNISKTLSSILWINI